MFELFEAVGKALADKDAREAIEDSIYYGISAKRGASALHNSRDYKPKTFGEAIGFNILETMVAGSTYQDARRAVQGLETFASIVSKKRH